MSFCTQCGAKNADGAKFCTSCGSRLAVPAEPAAPVVPAPPAAPESAAIPEAPVVPVVPVVPEAPEVPVVPEVPAVPETPVVPEVPAAPEASVVPEVPVIPEAPLDPQPPVPPAPPSASGSFVPPVPPAAPVPESPVPNGAPEQNPYSPLAQPKKKKTGLWIALGCVGAIVILAVLLACLLLGGGKSKLAKALDKTMEAFYEPFEAAGLGEVGENLEKIAKSGARTMNADFQINVGGTGITVALNDDFDQGRKIESGNVTVGVDEYGSTMELLFRYSADGDNNLMLAAPQFTDSVLSVNTGTLGKDAKGSDLMDLTGLSVPKDLSFELFPDGKDAEKFQKELEKACGKQYSAFIKSIELTDEEKHNGESTYTVVADPDAAYELLKAYLNFLQENDTAQELIQSLNMSFSLSDMEGLDLDELEDMLDEAKDVLEDFPGTLKVTIAGGYLVGVQFETEYGEEIRLELLGGSNPWESYVFYIYDGYDTYVMEGGLTEKKGALTWTNSFYQADYEDEAATLIFTLKKGEYAVSYSAFGEEEEIFSGEIKAENGGAMFSMEMDIDGDSLNFSMELLPLQYAPAVLSKSPMELFDMDEDELYELVMEIEENFYALMG